MTDRIDVAAALAMLDGDTCGRAAIARVALRELAAAYAQLDEPPADPWPLNTSDQVWIRATVWGEPVCDDNGDPDWWTLAVEQMGHDDLLISLTPDQIGHVVRRLHDQHVPGQAGRE